MKEVAQSLTIKSQVDTTLHTADKDRAKILVDHALVMMDHKII